MSLASAESLYTQLKLNETTYEDIKDKLPPLNLPDHILFPRNVKDIVEIVEHAGSKCLSVSIKNGGHSYHGASTQAGSIQLNMREFPKYSETSIVECVSGNTGNACKLALARSKNATIRVGGGELWDSVYRAVLNYPLPVSSTQTPRYDVVGGGAGTVSAIGGWMQGGGESIGDERMYGFGVDQVLELEMVLADGSHIKFGPTEWEVETKFMYPRTIKVEGLCNSNVLSSEESDWQWESCTSEIPFDQLWKAVRGGGGGTYGIVTAATYQLHPHKPLHQFAMTKASATALGTNCELQQNCVQADKAIVFFFMDLLFNPELVGLDEDTSNGCGHPGFSFEITTYRPLFCREPLKVKEAWIEYVKKLDGLDNLQEVLLALFSFELIGTYAQLLISKGGEWDLAPAGKMNDYPPPSPYPSTVGCWSILVPKYNLKYKTDEIWSFLKYFGGSSHVIGGKTSVAHDQMTAMNPIQRESGLQACIPERGYEEVVRGILLPTYNALNPNQTFPGGTEYNHISNILFGPLKSNHAKPCPEKKDYSWQKENCVSIEESVWGTTILIELELIKKKVDPHNMFKCYRCIGYDNVGCKAGQTSAPSPAASSATRSGPSFPPNIMIIVNIVTTVMIYIIF